MCCVLCVGCSELQAVLDQLLEVQQTLLLGHEDTRGVVLRRGRDQGKELQQQGHPLTIWTWRKKLKVIQQTKRQTLLIKRRLYQTIIVFSESIARDLPNHG